MAEEREIDKTEEERERDRWGPFASNSSRDSRGYTPKKGSTGYSITGDRAGHSPGPGWYNE